MATVKVVLKIHFFIIILLFVLMRSYLSLLGYCTCYNK